MAATTALVRKAPATLRTNGRLKVGGTFECPCDCPVGKSRSRSIRVEVGWCSGFGHEQAERHKRADCDVLVIDEILLGERQAFHDVVPVGDILDIQQEDGSAPI